MCLVCSSIVFAVKHQSWEALWSLAVLLVGVAMSFL